MRWRLTGALLVALALAVHPAEEDAEDLDMLPVARAIRQISFPGASQGLFASRLVTGERGIRHGMSFVCYTTFDSA